MPDWGLCRHTQAGYNDKRGEYDEEDYPLYSHSIAIDILQWLDHSTFAGPHAFSACHAHLIHIHADTSCDRS
jgi:hypothetical protein